MAVAEAEPELEPVPVSEDDGVPEPLEEPLTELERVSDGDRVPVGLEVAVIVSVTLEEAVAV